MGNITGLYFNIVKNQFAKSAGEAEVLTLCREIGIPDAVDDNVLYSVVDYNILMEEGLRRFKSGQTIEQGLYKLGEDVFHGFTKTTIGRVAMHLSTTDPKRLAARTPRHYECFVDWGEVTFEDTGEKTYELRFKNFQTSPHYDHGIIAAGTEAAVQAYKIDFVIHRFETPNPGVIDADFDFHFELL